MEARFKTDAAIEKVWLRLLRRDLRAGEFALEKLSAGYYAMVVAREQALSATELSAPHQALEARIPHLERTRAVYLHDAKRAYHLPGAGSLRSWAGDAAGAVEIGARQALAVVDVDMFARHLATQLNGCGWGVEQAGGEMRVSNERFAESLNLLRAAVRMVLWRSNAAEAARVIVWEMRDNFVKDASFYDRFDKRFAGFRPGVIDHFFVAYPVDSCTAVGWDYWELAGRDAAEAETVFGQGMREFENLLNDATTYGLAHLPPDPCGVSHSIN